MFLHGFKKSQRPITKTKYAGNYFWVLSSSKKPSYYKYFFELHDHYIFCKKDEKSDEIAYMDIKHSFVKITEGTIINGEPFTGIKFIKKKTYEELFTQEPDVTQQWLEYLKRFCILTKFRLYYETKSVVGKGNFAKVFLVERKADKQKFAVKVFAKNALSTDAIERRCLINEIAIMRELNHPRILKLYELYEGENFVYCLCQLYTGQDLLNAIIKKGCQPERKALTMIQQILEALKYMHSRGFMHRDLKSENILFKTTSEEIDLAIVDLGFATFHKDYKKLFVRCGTPGYVAPEILRDREYDCKVDVFSTGVILYIMYLYKSYWSYAF